MLASTHRAFSIPVTVGCLMIATKTSDMYQGDIWAQAIPIATTIVTAWVASSMPDWDRYIPFLKHRGLSHAIWLPLLVLLYALYIPYGIITNICLGFCCGYFSHILGDSFSVAGAAWFYPIVNYKRYESGAFFVQGFRGICIPLYRSGEKTFINMKWVWYGLGIVVFTLYLGMLPAIISV